MALWLYFTVKGWGQIGLFFLALPIGLALIFLVLRVLSQQGKKPGR